MNSRPESIEEHINITKRVRGGFFSEKKESRCNRRLKKSRRSKKRNYRIDDGLLNYKFLRGDKPVRLSTAYIRSSLKKKRGGLDTVGVTISTGRY